MLSTNRLKILPYRWEHALVIDSKVAWFPYNFKDNLCIEWQSTESIPNTKRIYTLSNNTQIVFKFNANGDVIKKYQLSYENGKKVKYKC